MKPLNENFSRPKDNLPCKLASIAKECDIWLGKEHEWIKHWADGASPMFGHLYARLLKRWPPRAMDMWPVGIYRYLIRMVWGVKVRRPWLCYPIEK